MADDKFSMTDEELKALSKLFSNEHARNAALNITTSNEVRGNMSSAPYYKAKYAQQLIPALRALTEDGKPRIFLYADFPSYSKYTLYLRIYQSFLYLADKLDENSEFKNLREVTQVRRSKAGIVIEITSGNKKTLESHAVSEPRNEFKWREDVRDFIVSGEPGQKYVNNDIALSLEDVTELENMLKDLPGIVSVIKFDSIKILKIKT